MDYVITPRHWELVMGKIVDTARDDWPVKPYVLWQQADQPSSGGPTGVMIALYLDGDVARALASIGATQPSDRMHMTIAFLVDDAEDLRGAGTVDNLKDAVCGWARLTSPLAARINGLGVFNPGPASDTPVTYVNVDCPGLPAARQALVESLSDSGLDVDTTHGFTPHVTVGYGDLSQDVPRPDLATVFDTVTVAIGSSKVSYKLGGPGSRL